MFRPYQRVCVFVLFFMVSAASFNGFYEKWHFRELGLPGGEDKFNFQAMVDGTAWRPYVYRQMLPSIANWIDKSVSQETKNRWYKQEWMSPIALFDTMAISPAASNRAYFFRYLIVYVCTFFFALLAVYGMHLVCLALKMPAPSALLAPVTLILLVPYAMSVGGYSYDFSELALFALAVWITLKFDWWWAIPIAALGTWNKESFLLFIPTLYPMIRSRRSRLGTVVGIAVLIGVCAAVYYPETIRFAHNPGDPLDFHLRDQLQLFEQPKLLLWGSEETFGMRMLRGSALLPLALLVWTVWRGWKNLPDVIKRHGQIAAVVNIPLYVFCCYPGELRDLSLLYITFLVILAVNLNDWLKRSDADSMRGVAASPVSQQ